MGSRATRPLSLRERGSRTVFAEISRLSMSGPLAAIAGGIRAWFGESRDQVSGCGSALLRCRDARARGFSSCCGTAESRARSDSFPRLGATTAASTQPIALDHLRAGGIDFPAVVIGEVERARIRDRARPRVRQAIQRLIARDRSPRSTNDTSAPPMGGVPCLGRVRAPGRFPVDGGW